MTFALSTDECAKLAAWLAEHDKTCPFARYSGAVGGRLTYSITPTFLLPIVKVQCACHPEAVVDLTDYDAF